MNFLIILATFIAAAAAGHSPQTVAVNQDTVGNYNLKYVIDGISRVEQGDGYGNVVGGYSYIDPYGIVRKTQFTSGVHGFNAVGTDIPLPVQDTPEVARAKADHLAAVYAAKLIPRYPQFQGPDYVDYPQVAVQRIAPLSFSPAPIVHAPVVPLPVYNYVHGRYIQDTPEVIAAKAQHFAAHAAIRGGHPIVH